MTVPIGGPDAAFSMEKEEFTAMVNSIRNVEKALGDIITENNVRSVRSGYGLHPKNLFQLIGKKVNCNLEKGIRMSYDYVG